METPATPTPVVETSKDAKTFAMLCHLSALAGYIIPFGNIIGPLIVWQMKKNEFPFVDEQGKEAVNFQITVTIAMVICILLMFVLIGIPLMFVVGIGALILAIMAGLKANNGESYRYPFTIRLIK